MGCAYFNQGKGSCLKGDRCLSPMVLKPKLLHSPREKAKASEEVLIRLAIQLRLPGAIPPEVVHPLEDRARDALLIPRSIRVSLATILQGASVPSGIGLRLDITVDMEEGRLRLYAYRARLVWQQHRVIFVNEEPEMMHVYAPYIEYGRTHKHSPKRARQTHRKIRNNKAEPAYSSKKGSAVQVWADRVVSCLKRGPSNMNEYVFI